MIFLAGMLLGALIIIGVLNEWHKSLVEINKQQRIAAERASKDRHE